MVIGELAAGFAHHAHIGIVQTPTRAYAIEKDADLDPRLCALAKCVTKLAAYFIRMENVTGKVHGLPRGADRFEHGREIFVAVGEQLDFVARDRNRIAKR